MGSQSGIAARPLTERMTLATRSQSHTHRLSMFAIIMTRKVPVVYMCSLTPSRCYPGNSASPHSVTQVSGENAFSSSSSSQSTGDAAINATPQQIPFRAVGISFAVLRPTWYRCSIKCSVPRSWYSPDMDSISDAGGH